MIKHNQDGAVNGPVVSLVLSVVLLLAAIGFGFWAFSSRQDYKNRSDAKVEAAVQVAVAKESTAKDQQFAEQEKNPFKTYNGPEDLGSLVLKYPKTWSGYTSTSGNNGALLDLYFNPGLVPSTGDSRALYALRVQVLNQSYATVMQSFSGQQQSGLVTVSAYALPKLPKVVGAKVSGTFPSGIVATVVVLPIRSQTLEIETDGSQYLKDFNNNILPSISFSP